MVLFDRSCGFKVIPLQVVRIRSVWLSVEIIRELFTKIYDGLVSSKTTEEDFSLELYIFLPNMNFKWLEEILFLFMHELLYFKDVQPRNNVRIS